MSKVIDANNGTKFLKNYNMKFSKNIIIVAVVVTALVFATGCEKVRDNSVDEQIVNNENVVAKAQSGGSWGLHNVWVPERQYCVKSQSPDCYDEVVVHGCDAPWWLDVIFYFINGKGFCDQTPGDIYPYGGIKFYYPQLSEYIATIYLNGVLEQKLTLSVEQNENTKVYYFVFKTVKENKTVVVYPFVLTDK